MDVFLWTLQLAGLCITLLGLGIEAVPRLRRR
jgi:hypothetical protein